MSRWLIFAFGVVAYLAGVRTLLYFVFFSSNLVVSRTVDSGPDGAWPAALAIDVTLLSTFALFHSLMARRTFKRAWTRWVPPSAERSVYVLVAALTLSLLMWQWRPIPIQVWSVDLQVGRYALLGVASIGWLLAAISLVSLGHLQLFGLRQALAYFRGDSHDAGGLVTSGVYRYLRDPMFVGYCVGIWSTPHMTLGHLVFAVGMTAYVIVGTFFERRDLRARFGNRYVTYTRE